MIDDTTNDLLIENGDFVLDNAEQQNVNFILIASKGSFYETPRIGVNALRSLNSGGSFQRLKQEIKTNLQFDGYRNITIDKINDQLFVDAKRET